MELPQAHLILTLPQYMLSPPGHIHFSVLVIMGGVSIPKLSCYTAHVFLTVATKNDQIEISNVHALCTSQGKSAPALAGFEVQMSIGLPGKSKSSLLFLTSQ